MRVEQLLVPSPLGTSSMRTRRYAPGVTRPAPEASEGCLGRAAERHSGGVAVGVGDGVWVGVGVGVAVGDAVGVGVGGLPPQTGHQLFASPTHVLSHATSQQKGSKLQTMSAQLESSQLGLSWVVQQPNGSRVGVAEGVAVGVVEGVVVGVAVGVATGVAVGVVVGVGGPIAESPRHASSMKVVEIWVSV